MLLSGVTRAWGRATRCLRTTYITVFPYRFFFKLLSHSVLHTWSATLAWGAHALVHTASRCREVSRVPGVFTQAAGGWRSCAEGVPIGRSAASASSAPSSEDDRKVRPAGAHILPLLNVQASLIYSLDWFRCLCHFAETNKCRTKLCTLLNGNPILLKSLAALSSTLLGSIDESIQYKLLIMKLESIEISEIKQSLTHNTGVNLCTGRNKNGFSAKN